MPCGCTLIEGAEGGGELTARAGVPCSSCSSPPPSKCKSEKMDSNSDSDGDCDPIWEAIKAEAKSEADKEPILSSFLYASILSHHCLESALGFVLANRLQNPTLLATQLVDIFDNVMMNDNGIQCSVRLDLQALKDRDPACASYSWALLYLKKMGVNSLALLEGTMAVEGVGVPSLWGYNDYNEGLHQRLIDTQWELQSFQVHAREEMKKKEEHI